LVFVVSLCGKGMLNYYTLEVQDDCAIYLKNGWHEVCRDVTFEFEEVS
jgi:hypothetical protein